MACCEHCLRLREQELKARAAALKALIRDQTVIFDVAMERMREMGHPSGVDAEHVGSPDLCECGRDEGEHDRREHEPSPHPCGHWPMVEGCGGCDPAAIDHEVDNPKECGRSGHLWTFGPRVVADEHPKHILCERCGWTGSISMDVAPSTAPPCACAQRPMQGYNPQCPRHGRPGGL